MRSASRVDSDNHTHGECLKMKNLPKDDLFYMAIAISPEDDETLHSNHLRAYDWYRFLVRSGLKICAPYLSLLEVLDDHDPDERQLGIEVDLAHIPFCKGIILVGPRLSTGMKTEKKKMLDSGGFVIELIGMGRKEALETIQNFFAEYKV